MRLKSKKKSKKSIAKELLKDLNQIVKVEKNDIVLNDKELSKYSPSSMVNFTTHNVNLKSLFKKIKGDVFRVVVLPDSHVPHHDKKTYEAVLSFIKDYKPHGLINLGDFMDMSPVSHWEKGNHGKRLAPEMIEGNKVLNQIDKALGSTCVYKCFITGNHEDWLNQYLESKVPELGDLTQFGIDISVEKMLKLKERGYTVIPLNEILSFGSANFIHGYYTGTAHAKKHLDVFGCNIYYGHLHDVQSYSGVNVKGLHESMSLGCLSTLNAKFLKGKPNNWSHCIGIFEFYPDGSFTRYAPIIYNGQFSFNGKRY